MKIAWVPLMSASLLCAFLAPASAQQGVILVRHAELQGAAMAEPRQLPLSEVGEARAQRLASLLKDSGVGAIYVTDFVRTNKTAEPLARALNQEVTVLPKGDPRDLVERLRKNHGGQIVLLVGHTDTLPGLLKALGHAPDITIEAQDYSSLFVVVPQGDRAPTMMRLRY